MFLTKVENNVSIISSNRQKDVCNFYGIIGHTIEKCYKKHGYPLNRNLETKNMSAVNQVQANTQQVTTLIRSLCFSKPR